jgi:phage tail sheath protein FI
MPEYLSPGVYVEEIDAGPKPIAPVATSTAGTVGVTERGPDTPTLVTSYGDFLNQFGGVLPLPDDAIQSAWLDRGRYWQMAESVKAFFDEGGARLYVQRVVPSGAVASSAAFDGGLYAGLTQDVNPASTTLSLTHVFGIGANDQLAIVTEDGSAIGQPVTVASVDYATRTVTLTGAANLGARRDRDLAVVLAVDTNLDTLTAAASSAGAWGDDVTVAVMPMRGARLALGATPTSGNAVASQTAADAAANDTTIDVTAVPGLDANTPVPFTVRINGGAPVAVTAVADAAPNVTLTLATALAADLPAGATVAVLRPAVNGQVVTVESASRLYENALVQLEGAAGAELLTVTTVAGSQVTLSAAPANAYLEGDGVSIVEAQVDVVYRRADGTEQTERFSGLRLVDEPDPSSLIAGVNLRSKLVELTAGANYSATNLQSFPAVTTGRFAPLDGGDDALASLTSADFVGVNLGPGQRTGIQALEEIDQVAICFVPGMHDADIRSQLIIHCETLADRFAILDPPPDLGVQEVEAFRSPIDTKYAALYYPWVRIRDPRGGDLIDAPPSGFLAGIYARVDVARGVHKAPANEVVRSIREFAANITKREQDILNPQNINVLRAFPGRGNRVWGARVLTSDPAWRYINVRRLFLMIEESIDEATQYAVFEPNDETLWARIRQSVTNFLITQWRIGALQGVTADEAFFVTCDRSTMTQDDIDNGRLICVIGIAPVKPAEFVIFRIQQKTLELTT